MSVASETNSSGEDELSDEDEELDPRIQDGLEKLNAATNSINHLEAELDEARAVFRQTMGAATYHLNHQAQKLGKCVDKARPFYESLRELRFSHQNLHKSALQFERANGMHVAARTRVREAEHRVFSGDTKLRPFDGALQEMLNQATIEVSEAAKSKRESWERHQVSYKNYQQVQNKVRTLQKKLTSSIEKAKPYFEQKVGFDRHLWQLKLRVDSIHKGLSQAKANYSDCLKSLEVISDEIHQKRKDRKMISMLAELHERGAGVGAESSTEDLSQSQLDLDLDCSTSLSEVDGMIPGEISRSFSEASSTRQVPSVSQSVKTVASLERTVTGSEAGVSSLEREVYGDESQVNDIQELMSEANLSASTPSNSVSNQKIEDNVEKSQPSPDNIPEENAGFQDSLPKSADAPDVRHVPEAKSDDTSVPSNSVSDQTIQETVKKTPISPDSTTTTTAEVEVEVEGDLPDLGTLEVHADVAAMEKSESDGGRGLDNHASNEMIQDIVEQNKMSPDPVEKTCSVGDSADVRGGIVEEENSYIEAHIAPSVEYNGAVDATAESTD